MEGGTTLETDYLVVSRPGSRAHGSTSSTAWASTDDPAEIKALQGRFFAALGPAFEKLQTFTEQATPRERARIFDPTQHVTR